MPAAYREPWNPFDTSDKICFPNLIDALDTGPTADGTCDVVDIAFLAEHHSADIDQFHPPDLGYLPLQLTQILEAKCQAWFDEQKRIKAARVGLVLPMCCWL